MVASSNDIRTNSDKSSIYEDRGWKRSDPVPDHIYDIHKSLVEEEVIIRSEIISCSKQFISKIEKDLPNPDKKRRIKRCHYVNLCPICNNLLEQFVEKQIKSILEDISVDAIKIGMLFNTSVIKTVARCLREIKNCPIVLDPVMFAKSGDRLLQEDAVESIKSELFPLATIITPNIPEAEALLNCSIESFLCLIKLISNDKISLSFITSLFEPDLEEISLSLIALFINLNVLVFC